MGSFDKIAISNSGDMIKAIADLKKGDAANFEIDKYELAKAIEDGVVTHYEAEEKLGMPHSMWVALGGEDVPLKIDCVDTVETGFAGSCYGTDDGNTVTAPADVYIDADGSVKYNPKKYVVTGVLTSGQNVGNRILLENISALKVEDVIKKLPFSDK